MTARRRLVPIWFEAPEHPPVDSPLRIRVRAGARPVHLCLAIIRSAGWYAAAGALLMVCGNVASMLLPLAVGASIDQGIAPVVDGEPWRDAIGQWAVWAGVIAVIYGVMNVAGRFGGRLGWYGVQRARYELADRVLDRVLDTRGMSGPGRLPGTLLSVVTLDVQRACQSIYVAVYPLGELIAVAVAAVSLFLIHPALGFGVLIGAPVLLAVMAWVGGPLMRRSEAEQELVADATATAADLVSGYRVVTGIHAQGAAVERYRGVSREALAGTVAARTAQSIFEGASTTLTGLFSAAVAVGAAALAFSGEISVGGLIAAAGVAQVLLVPLQSLVGEAGSLWAMALASAGRVIDVLETPYRADTAGHVAPREDSGAELTAQALPLTRGRLDLEVRRGEFVVLDLAGADAQALADALSVGGHRDGGDLSGHLRFRDVPLLDLDPELLRSCVVVAPRQAELFEGSVLDNVIGVDCLDSEVRARAALAVAHCESLADQLPDGYATSVGERGRRLSGGQRQRIALARAIAADPPVLLLHEPTNAVDSVSEATIAARVREARRGRTTIVISSSAAFRSVADRVVRLEQPAGASS